MKEIKCSNCGADLQTNLVFIEDGCRNYTNYKYDKEEKCWLVDYEVDGMDCSESFFSCKECQEPLSKELDDYFWDKTH